MFICVRARAFGASRYGLILAALLAVSLLGACGQKGALRLPQDAPKNAPSDAAK